MIFTNLFNQRYFSSYLYDIYINYVNCINTVFPRNLAAARFNFKSLHPATKFRGRRLVHSPTSRLHTSSSISIVRIARVRLHSAYTLNPTTLFHAARFEGGVYWNQPPYRCGKISRVAGFQGVARFRGNTVVDLIIDYIPYFLAIRRISRISA